MVYSQYKKVHIGGLSTSKLKKAVKTGKLTLSKEDLAGNSYTLHLHPETHKRFQKAQKGKKGITINQLINEIKADMEHHKNSGMEGGSIWSSIKDFVNKNWDVIKPVLSRVADVAIPALSTVVGMPELGLPARALTKELTGVGLKEKRIANLKKARDAKLKKRINFSGGSFLSAGER